MKRFTAAVTTLLLLLIGMVFSAHVFAADGTTNYSGDFWSRSTLTGDWDSLSDTGNPHFLTGHY